MSNNTTDTWANPTPAALVALAAATFCFFAMFQGFIEHSALPLLGCILIGGFVIQFVTAIVDLKQGSLSGGNAFMLFGSLIMLVSGLETFFKAAGGVDVSIDGWLWLAVFVALVLWAPAYAKGPALLFFIVILLLPAVLLISLCDLGLLAGGTFLPIAGWFLLASGAVALYLSAVILVNGTYGRNVYPSPGPLYKGKK